ncbi:peptidase M14 [Mycena galericulata]|nr:peptidase M14 [Mycena galericulata]
MLRTHLWPVLLLFLPFLATASAPAHQQTFSAPRPGTLHRFHPNTTKTLAEVLRIVQTHGLDIWQIRTESTPYVDIYSAPNSPSLPESLLATPHAMSDIRVPPPPQWVDADSADSNPDDWALDTLANSTFHNAYHPQFEVDAFIHALARLHPAQVDVLRLGHSAEERELLGLRISAAPENGNEGEKKMGFMVLGPQHAREWVATSTALYIAHALLAPANQTGSLAHLLKVYDFHILPSPNPDGYVHTWESDRFWYKNRQVVGPNAACVGIDMNRNWGAHWKPHADTPFFDSDFSQSSSSSESPTPRMDLDDNEDENTNANIHKNTRRNKKKNKKKKEPADPCSHWYPGHRAFEAPEVNAVANYITKVNGIGKGAGKEGPGGKGLAGFVELRSYGQMLAAPYSYKCDKLPKDAEDQMEALLGAAQAGRGVYGTGFATGTLCELLYRAPGNLLDYVYSAASIKYSYAAFLRDTGTYGFALPPAWIRPVGEETGVMVEYLARFIARQKGVDL